MKLMVNFVVLAYLEHPSIITSEVVNLMNNNNDLIYDTDNGDTNDLDDGLCWDFTFDVTDDVPDEGNVDTPDTNLEVYKSLGKPRALLHHIDQEQWPALIRIAYNYSPALFSNISSASHSCRSSVLRGAVNFEVLQNPKKEV
ncbi:hypothetical protein BC941DRAFT_432339 [Chlamydoabsidia padenii]|nr:hypothetical protein BC941DRAFT_432339 [Chlamydoabsidia padenii]